MVGAMQKVAFELGPFTVHWYGILVAAGFLAGLWTASRRGMRDGLAPERILDFGPWLILGSILGARILYVISYWKEEFASGPLTEVFMIQNGGLVFYGGLMGASLATILYARWRKLPLWKLADAMAPSIALGSAFGRFGCLMYGCCYGKSCALPWAVHFPADHPTHGAGIHPTQIYDSGLNLALYLALAWFYRRKRFDGQVFAIFLICYAITRSFVEIFRGDYPAKYLSGHLTPAHLVSMATIAVGVALYWWLRSRSGRPTPQPA